MAKITKPVDSEKVKKVTKPTLYTPELALLICKRIATTTMGNKALCEEFEDMPGTTTFYNWRYEHPEFDEMVLKAKEMQANLMAEEMEDIANERMFYYDSEGNKRIETGFTNEKRLRIDTRKFIAAKLQPKRFGDKIQMQTTNNEETEALKAELKELREKLANQSKSEY